MNKNNHLMKVYNYAQRNFIEALILGNVLIVGHGHQHSITLGPMLSWLAGLCDEQV